MVSSYSTEIGVTEATLAIESINLLLFLEMFSN